MRTQALFYFFLSRGATLSTAVFDSTADQATIDGKMRMALTTYQFLITGQIG
jgi:hypothetical protein